MNDEGMYDFLVQVMQTGDEGTRNVLITEDSLESALAQGRTQFGHTITAITFASPTEYERYARAATEAEAA